MVRICTMNFGELQEGFLPRFFGRRGAWCIDGQVFFCQSPFVLLKS